MIDEKTVDTEKIIDEIQEEFEKVNIPIMDKLTLFAKVQNAIYRCSKIERQPCDDAISRQKEDTVTKENYNEQMDFPNTWEEFEKDYGFYDTNEVYTNGSRLIQSFRVKQWLEHQMTAEEYRQRMIQAFHNADCDRLIAICALPTEKEFEHLEWLLKTHYKKESCEDCISREDAIACCRNEWEEEVADRIEALPSVQPKSSFINKPCISEGVCHDIAVQKMIECEDAVSREAVFDVLNCGQDLPDRLFDMVEELPRVYLEPKVGHWIPDDTICEDTLYRCSNCDNVYYSNYGDIKDMGYNYCPNCGCQMLRGDRRKTNKLRSSTRNYYCPTDEASPT